MNVESLETEWGIELQPKERQLFLDELTFVAQNYKQSLGSSDQTEERKKQLQEIQEITANFNQEVVEFAFRQIVPLDEALFTKLNLDTPPYIDYLLQRFKFYKLDLPITINPQRWGFQRLKCHIEFNPHGLEVEGPVAYQIFPEQEWQDIFHIWQNLEVGLDATLQFKLLGSPEILEQLSNKASLKAAIEPKIASKAGFILEPFDFYIRRPKIKTRGRDSYRVWWDLEGEDQITQAEPRLGVILKVPKNINQVDVKGELLAYRSVNFFTILHDLWDLLSTPAQNYFQSGAPVPAKMEFKNITSGI